MTFKGVLDKTNGGRTQKEFSKITLADQREFCFVESSGALCGRDIPGRAL